MSNVANQVVAVAATLLGFVAHDLLSDDKSVAPQDIAAATIPVADPIVTRSVKMDLSEIHLASFAAPGNLQPAAPVISASGRTPAVKSDDFSSALLTFAGARSNVADAARRLDPASSAYLR